MADVDVKNLTEGQKAALRRQLGIAGPGELTKTERYAIWFFGTVVVAVLPIVCSAILRGSWVDEIYKGQLLISSLGVYGAAAAGAYVVQTDRKRLRSIRTTIIVSGFAFVGAAAFLYQGFSGVERSEPGAHSEHKVTVVSYLIGTASLLAGGSHTYIAIAAEAD